MSTSLKGKKNRNLKKTFNTGDTKSTDHCIIGNIGTPSDKSHLIGCIGEIIGFCRSLTDKETSYIHKHLMKKWGVIADPIWVSAIHFGCVIGDQLVLPFYLYSNLCCGVSCHRCGIMLGNCTIVQSCDLSQSRMQFCFQGSLYYPNTYEIL